MGISVYELANAIKVPRSRVNDIVLGRRAVTTDTGYFGTTPEFWINLQAHYDLDLAGLRAWNTCRSGKTPEKIR